MIAKGIARWCPDGLIAPALILLLFGATLVGSERLAFRDVSHFYTPLYGYVAQHAKKILVTEDGISLWNPRCQTGMPLLGETSTAVLYPVRYAIGSLPISAERQIAWYVTLHLILASMMVRYAAGQAGAKRLGRLVAGLIYPLSGSVLFLYTNPPFLVGAAWLPLALSVLVHHDGLKPLKRTALLALGLAMMVLGGDPQTALHVVLVGAAVMFAKIACCRSTIRGFVTQDVPVIAAAGVLAIAMSSPQLAASISWSQQSDRIAKGTIEASWFDPPKPGGRKHEAMQFSVAPWHLAELIAPRAFGSLFPIYRRVSSLIAGDGRMWTATLFMGLLPVLMIVDRIMQLWKTKRIPQSGDLWLLLSLASLLLAMGHFGLLWWIQWATGSFRSTDSAAFGPYWCLFHFLPGYDAFRYPAKWLPFFAIGLSVATGLWIDRQEILRIKLPMLFVAVALLGALVCTLFVSLDRPPLPVDPFWGPLDIEGGLHEIRVSIIFSLLCLTALWISIRKFKDASPTMAIIIVICLLALELASSASSQIATVSMPAEESILAEIRTSMPQGSAGRLMRMKTGTGWPDVWQSQSSRERLLEVEASQRANQFGRWHLDGEHSVFNNFVSIRSRNHDAFWKAVMRLQREGVEVDWKEIQRWLAVNGVLTQTTKSREIQVNGASMEIAISHIQENDPPPPGFSVHSQWRTLSDDTNVHAQMQRRVEEVVSQANAAPMLNPNDQTTVIPDDSEQNHLAYEIEAIDTGHSIKVTCNQPCLLVRAVYQDGNWAAERKMADSDKVKGEMDAVYQVDFLKQGIVVPPGSWQIRFRYQPWWWTASKVMMAIGWIALVPLYVLSRVHCEVGSSEK